jgi:predicted Zn finger-like uncharacterized protein
MKFVCERCHTKYSIADEKVRGKVLKVRCKTCANVITVRETGATIDDAAFADGPRESAVSRSGSFDAGAGDGDTVVAPRGGRLGKVGGIPAAALFAPSAPIAAPPPKRVAPPPAPSDDIEWYLAVDGAQTGPFSRARLIDKVLGTAKQADVHVWNADFDGWKPPTEVADLRTEIVRRRRALTPVPPPPAHRPPTAGVAVLGSAGAAGGNDGGLIAIESSPLADGLPGRGPMSGRKKNGVAATSAAAAASAAALGAGFGDILGTPPPVAVGQATARPSATFDAAAARNLAPAPSQPGLTAAPKGLTSKAKQVRLIMGALAVVLVLCGIVSMWIFRRPAAGVAAVQVTPAKASTPDFAAMAEQLKRDEAQAEKAVEKAPVVTPPPAEDPKPVVARFEQPQRSTRGKQWRRKSQTSPPPLSAGSGLTAEQRDAANRFGESTGRDVRVPTSSGSSARSTPAQADISRVINNNRQGIQTCYQRALLRDNTLTHGKVTVRVSIGLSGKVKSVNLDAPAQFRALEPCIRDVMSRWAFPPSSEEYGTEFPVVLQGNQ